MREDDDDGRPRVYWIGHKTQLLRCAPHHVRPEIGRSTSTLIGDLQVAKDMLQALKSRGVTRYSDLTIKNKRNIDDVDSGDEMMDDGDSDDDHPPSTKRRLVDPAVYEREALGISEFEQIERELDFTPAPPSVPYSPSVASSIANDAEQPHPIGLRDRDLTNKLPVATRLDLRSTPKLLDLDFWSLSSLEMETSHSLTCRAMKLTAKFLSLWNLLES